MLPARHNALTRRRQAGLRALADSVSLLTLTTLLATNTFLTTESPPAFLNMDTLVAQYSRPVHEDEVSSSREELELSQAAPPLSLNFALPPVARVRLICAVQDTHHLSKTSFELLANLRVMMTAFSLAPGDDRRLLEPRLPHQTSPWHDDTRVSISRRNHRCDGLSSDGGELDRQSDGEEGH